MKHLLMHCLLLAAFGVVTITTLALAGPSDYRTVFVNIETGQRIMAVYGEDACYYDGRHGGKGGITYGYVCLVPSGWRKAIR